jgi:SAM-dependent methyltransferase
VAGGAAHLEAPARLGLSAEPCVVCEASSWRPAVRRRAYGYAECAVCGLERLDPLPIDPASAGGGTPACTDGDDDSAADVAAQRANARRRLTMLREAGAMGGTVIDVGCDSGTFLDEARARGWQPVGVDPSPEARARTSARTGARTFASLTAASADGVGPVDVVTFSALEQTPSPEHAVADAWAILRPGGLLTVEAWDAASFAARLLGDYWPPVVPPPALYLFSRATLPRLLVNTGFDRATVRGTVRRESARRAAQALIRLHPGLTTPLTRLVLGTRVADVALTYGFGDLMSVAARKPLSRR